jgi:hypothetical protein
MRRQLPERARELAVRAAREFEMSGRPLMHALHSRRQDPWRTLKRFAARAERASTRLRVDFRQVGDPLTLADPRGDFTDPAIARALRPPMGNLRMTRARRPA